MNSPTMRTLPPATTRDTVRFRQAAAGDSGTVARLHRATVRACLPFLPDLHTAEEDSAYFRDRLFRDCTVWVAEVPAGRAASSASRGQGSGSPITVRTGSRSA